jgi:integrase
MAEVARLATVDMSGRKPSLSVARDTVMLSYYLGGRRFTDLVLFTPEDVQDGFLTFVVNKSKRKVIKRLFLSPEALAIIERYKGQGPYLLPLLKRKIENKKELLDAIDGANAKVNLALKVVAALAGINKNMTTRIMRHTVANLIKQSGLSTALASELLDHDDQSTTETYMDSFPSEAIKGVLINLAKAVPVALEG